MEDVIPQDVLPLESTWIVALVAAVMAIIMLLQLARALPGQNILMIVVGLLAGEALLEFLLAKLGRTPVTGPMWVFLTGAALLWMAVVLSARRLGQFILRPWRREKYYGFWLIAVSATVTGLFQFGWPRFDNPDLVGVHRAALMATLRGLGTVIFLVCLTPWLIRKRPVPQPAKSELAQQPKDEAEQDAGEQTSG
jgi:hypothetical protein